MQDNAKIGLAALGGYALGRTKKAKAAIGLALWLTGRKYRLKDLGRDQLLNLLKSEEGQKLIAQLRGPVMAAGKSAALGLYENQAGRISEGLAGRASKLIELTGGLSQGDDGGDDSDDSGGGGAPRKSPRKSRSGGGSSSGSSNGSSADDDDEDGAARLRKRRQSASSAGSDSGGQRRPAKSTSGGSGSSSKNPDRSRQTRSSGARSGSRSSSARSSS